MKIYPGHFSPPILLHPCCENIVLSHSDYCWALLRDLPVLSLLLCNFPQCTLSVIPQNVNWIMFLFGPNALIAPTSLRVKAKALTMDCKSLHDLSQIYYVFHFLLYPFLFALRWVYWRSCCSLNLLHMLLLFLLPGMFFLPDTCLANFFCLFPAFAHITPPQWGQPWQPFQYGILLYFFPQYYFCHTPRWFFQNT